MSIDRVRAFFTKMGRADDIMEFDVSSATVQLAAQAVGVPGAQIAKTISLRHADGGCIVVVAAGDAKISNRKFKDTFGFKAKMLTGDEALEKTGYAVGGVCPFALPSDVSVYLDESLRRFDYVYPACGSSNSAIKLTCDELQQYSSPCSWGDICDIPTQE